MSDVARRKVLGGRGNLGIVNSLRRQLIHIINWELNTTRDEGSVLRLLRILVNSVGSEHFRSVTAVEIIQCLDNVMRAALNRRTRSNWILLLNNIGKSNVIFRDYILYSTIEILKDEDRSEILQNLDAKCIFWRLANNFVYTLYSLVLKDDTENDEIRKYMARCLDERVSPPRELLDLFLRRNSCRDLLSFAGFRITSSIVGYLTYNLSEIEKMNAADVQDYIEVLSSDREAVEGRMAVEAIRNPFSEVVGRALENVIEKGEGSEAYEGFFHHLSLSCLIERVEHFPWSLRAWGELLGYLRKVLVFLSLSFVLDDLFGTQCGAIRSLTVSSLSKQSSLQELASFFRPNLNWDTDTNEHNLSQILQEEPLIRSLKTAKQSLINREAYLRYFNFGSAGNIRSEMQIIRFKVYSTLVLINHSNSFLNNYFKTAGGQIQAGGPHESQNSDLDLSFVLDLSDYRDLAGGISLGTGNDVKMSLFTLPVSLLCLLHDENDARSVFGYLQEAIGLGGTPTASSSDIFGIWAELERRHTVNGDTRF
ncbi:hypothetical protein OJ252_1739 [Cryptosporidium canis]|uniref:FPL domain-containing protein n=1 Tax=Cryptosporidium canis TaxID=195482 RepID=A0ABQ8P7A7_9CRYT|nr:hypothetical protein OJ252_1739 [Cryptosporidium canis]